MQKVAFECIMTYKRKYLKPYKENFLKLLDDKSFKNEIVLFSVNPETTVILEEHRSRMIPVLMRYVYIGVFLKIIFVGPKYILWGY